MVSVINDPTDNTILIDGVNAHDANDSVCIRIKDIKEASEMLKHLLYAVQRRGFDLHDKEIIQ